MSEDIRLPDIFPLDDIVVKEEQHLFEVFQGDNGPLPKTEYTLDKAPIEEIRTVTGTLNGQVDYEFEQGVDYELSADAEDILWLNGDRPDAGTRFAVTYRTASIMGRYIGSADEELDDIEEKIIDATQGKFVREAEGRELDELGSLFGDIIGKRRDRNDTQYRIYLQSVVQSFISRGTKTGIKLAVSAATNVPIEDITIEENFEKNEYGVIVIPNTPVTVSLVETIADIADPSGVSLVRTRFPLFEDLGINDRNRLNDNGAATSDTLFSDDTVTIPPSATNITDSLASDDTNTNSSTIVMRWDDHNWNGKEWTAEVN